MGDQDAIQRFSLGRPHPIDSKEMAEREGIAQHYTLPRIALANVVLDPTLPVAA